jgi:hypothetical protein
MRKAVFLGLAAVLLGAVPLAAQTHRSSVGLNGGAVLYGSFNSGADGSGELKPDPSVGAFGGIQYDWFFGSGHLGFRLAAHYQQMKLFWVNQSRQTFAYAGDFDLILRPIAPKADTKVIPFLSVGIGGTRYRFGTGNPTSFDAAGASYLGKESTQFSVLGGIGFDIVTGWGWDEGPFMIRLEAQDNYVLDSPFVPLEGSEEFGGVHNLRVSLGLPNTMGFLR